MNDVVITFLLIIIGFVWLGILVRISLGRSKKMPERDWVEKK